MKKALVSLVLLIGVLAFALAAPSRVAAAPAESGYCTQWYTVQWGDNLYRIALRHGTTVWALQMLNGIHNPNYVQWGQTLCVRGGYYTPAPHGFWYRIQWGDTLYGIARRYGVSVWTLASVNHIPYPYRIYAGRTIWIP